MFRAHYGGLFQPPARFRFAALMVLAYRVANSPAEITRLTVIVRIGTAAKNQDPDKFIACRGLRFQIVYRLT